jgi:DNA-directed RNA polymerase subunit RPC12/RpoP
MSTVRIGSIEANTPCSRCGQPIPLEGPDRKATCPHCQTVDDIPQKTWADILFRVDEALARMQGGQRRSETVGAMGGGRTVRFTIQQGRPRCHACQAELAEDGRSVGREGPVPCQGCGAESFGAPIKGRITGQSTAKWIWRKSRPGAAGGARVDVNQEAPRPVVFQCPKCAGGLEATAKSERVMRCRYCEAEVFIPDELWRRLHPVRKAEPFWVRFEGPTHQVRLRESQARSEQARRDRERAEHLRKLEKAEAEHAARSERARRQLPAAWIATFVFMALSGAFAALAWIAEGHVAAAPEGLRAFAVAMPVSAYLTWIGVSVVVLIVALVLTSKVLKTASGHAWEWVFFKTFFWAIMVLAPGASLIALYMAFHVARGRFGPARISHGEGGGHSYYDAVTLIGGEGRPAGLLLAWHALIWPVVILAFFL